MLPLAVVCNNGLPLGCVGEFNELSVRFGHCFAGQSLLHMPEACHNLHVHLSGLLCRLHSGFCGGQTPLPCSLEVSSEALSMFCVLLVLCSLSLLELTPKFDQAHSHLTEKFC